VLRRRYEEECRKVKDLSKDQVVFLPLGAMKEVSCVAIHTLGRDV
jgi:hypothetical protein